MGTAADTLSAAPTSSARPGPLTGRHAVDSADADGAPVAAGGERWWRLIVGATVTAMAVCAARTLLRGYVALEDNAVTELRARDVFTSHPPLVGMVSSASQQGSAVSHPGPLQLDLLAPAVRLLPAGTGLALGTAVINVAAVGATAWVARRLLGSFGGAVVASVVAVFVWSMGSEAVVESWQPIAAMMPFLCGLVATWAVAAGRDSVAPVAVIALSFAVQTHGSYLLLVPVVAAVGAALRVARHRHGVALDRRPLAVAGAVAALAWIQPVLDQIAGSGNISRLWAHAGRGDRDGAEAALGVAGAMRAVASVLVRPPMWGRGGVASSLPLDGGRTITADGTRFEPGWLALSWSVLGLAVLVGVLAAVVVVAVRRSDATLVAGGALAIAVVVAAILSAARLPLDAFGFSPHRVRWLWVIGAFVTAYLLVAGLRLGVAANRRDAVAVVVLAGVVAAAATLPTSNQLLSPQQFMGDRVDAARHLRDVAETFTDMGVVYVNTLGRPLPDPYHDALAAALVRSGIELRVAGEYSALQYGRHRRLGDGPDAADVTAHVFVGPFPDGLPAPYGEVARFADGPHVVVVGAAFGTVRGRPG